MGNGWWVVLFSVLCLFEKKLKQAINPLQAQGSVIYDNHNEKKLL